MTRGVYIREADIRAAHVCRAGDHVAASLIRLRSRMPSCHSAPKEDRGRERAIRTLKSVGYPGYRIA